MSRVTGDLIDDQLVSLWFMFLYAGALMLIARDGIDTSRRRAPLVALAALTATLAMSGVWSQIESRTFSQVILFVGTTAFAVWAADRFSARALTWMLFAAMQAGAFIGTWAVQRSWYQTLSRNRDWEGIYFNRNSFAPVAVLGLVTAVLLVVAEWDGARVRRTAAIVVGMVAAGAVDVVVIWKTNSATAIVGGVAFLGTAAGFLVLRWLRERGLSEPALAGVAAGGGTLALVAVVLARDPLADLLGRDAGLTRRRELWNVVIDWWQDQPIGGMGWMSVWPQDRFQVDVIAATGQRLPNAHNGYLEVLLGAGILGAAAMCAVLVVFIRRAFRAGIYAPRMWAVFLPAVLAYGLVVNTQEMFIGANLLVWVLMVIAGTHGAGDDRSPQMT